MKLILSLTLIFTCSGFFSFGQTKLAVTQIPIIDSYRGCSPPINYIKPNVIEVDKEIQFDENADLLDITDPNEEELLVRPNPSKGHISVAVPSSWIGFEIQVYDMAGRRIGNPVPITATVENFTLEGESGIYLVVIRTETNVFTKRILLDTH